MVRLSNFDAAMVSLYACSIVPRQTAVRLLGLSLLFGRVLCSGNVGSFWHVTDFHYDFTYESRNGDSCRPAVPVGERGMFGHHWCDSNWRLIQSAVQAMKRLKPNADFIVWTGDSTLHDNQQSRVLKKNNTVATIQNITSLIETVMPFVPVYAVLGNHDIIPDNQFPPFGSFIYRETWEMWKQWLPGRQKQTFLKGGYYRRDLGYALSLLALNTNLYFIDNEQTEGIYDPAEQFSWMDEQLNDIRKHDRTAILIGHIGPGVIPVRGITWMYDKLHARLIELLTRHSDVIQAIYAGHDHVDRFNILHDEETGKALVPTYFNIAVSPGRYQTNKKTNPDRNPGIRLITYEKDTGKQLNIHQYYLDLTQANKAGVAEWKLIYRMTDYLQMRDLTAESASFFWDKMKTSRFMVDDVVKRSVARMNSKPQCDKKCRDSWYCSMGHLTPSAYEKCMKAATSNSDKLFHVLGLGLIISLTVIHLLSL